MKALLLLTLLTTTCSGWDGKGTGLLICGEWFGLVLNRIQTKTMYFKNVSDCLDVYQHIYLS